MHQPENQTHCAGPPEFTAEECRMLIDILDQIDRQMQTFLKTSYLLSSCTFIFDGISGKDELFRGIYRKVCELTLRKASRFEEGDKE